MTWNIRKQCAAHNEAKFAQGGPVPDYRGEGEDADRVLEDEMYHAQAVDARNDKNKFFDDGVRIPGRQTERNYIWEQATRPRKSGNKN